MINNKQIESNVMRINKHSILLATIFSVMIKAQNSEWKVYNTSNSGLPVNQAQSIFIDQDDVKWIGTSAGVARFDNKNWIVYDTTNSMIPSNYITDIKADGNGGVWIGTVKGLVNYNSKQWKVFNTANSFLRSNEISSIHNDGNGSTWFCTNAGIAKLKNQLWEWFDGTTSGLGVDFARSVFVDKDGLVWIGTFDHAQFNGQLWYFNGVDWKYFRLTNFGLYSSFPDALVVDSENNVWLGTKGTTGGALVKIHNKSWVVYDKHNSGFPGGGINSIALEGDGKWIASSSGLLNLKNDKWILFNKNNSGLPDDFVFSIAVDKYGNKWIATIGGGVAVFRQGGVATSIEEKNKNPVTGYKLYDNYPNPFNPVTKIRFTVNSSGVVQLKIFAATGREIKKIVDQKNAGDYEVEINMNGFASGIYFYQLQAGNFICTKKFVLLK
jgi:ligand-binding sensor domain-containing protein